MNELLSFLHDPFIQWIVGIIIAVLSFVVSVKQLNQGANKPKTSSIDPDSKSILHHKVSSLIKNGDLQEKNGYDSYEYTLDLFEQALKLVQSNKDVQVPLVTSMNGTVDDQQQQPPPGVGIRSGSPAVVAASGPVTSPNGGDDNTDQDDDADDNVVSFPLGAPPAGPRIVDSTPPASMSPAPPAKQGDVADVPTAPTTVAGTSGPNPLELPRKGNRGKIPVVIPIPSAQPTAQPASPPPNQQSNTGNTAVVVPVGAAAPNVVGPPRTTIGGGPPLPPQGPTGDGRTPRRRRRGWLIIPLILLILLTLGL